MPLSDVKAVAEKEKAQLESFRENVQRLREAATEESLEASVFEALENFFTHRVHSLDHVIGAHDGQKLKQELRHEIKALNTCRAVLDAAVENLDPGELGAEPYIRLIRRQLKETRNARKQMRLRL